MFKQFSKWYKQYKKLNWKFDFGKYEGETLKFVIDYDMQYIVWCIEKNIFRIHIFAKPYANNKYKERCKNIRLLKCIISKNIGGFLS